MIAAPNQFDHELRKLGDSYVGRFGGEYVEARAGSYPSPTGDIVVELSDDTHGVKESAVVSAFHVMTALNLSDLYPVWLSAVAAAFERLYAAAVAKCGKPERADAPLRRPVTMNGKVVRVLRMEKG